MKRLEIIKYNISETSDTPLYVIVDLTIRISYEGELNSPRSNPKLQAVAGIVNIITRKKKWVNLEIIKSKLYWHSARFTAMNSEYFESKIKKDLVKLIGGEDET